MRTVNIFLDQIPNNAFQFDDFTCEPSDCCYLDYAIVMQKTPTAAVANTEAVLLKNFPESGKHTMNFKNDSKV